MAVAGDVGFGDDGVVGEGGTGLVELEFAGDVLDELAEVGQAEALRDAAADEENQPAVAKGLGEGTDGGEEGGV